ncbi:MAG: acyl carrier protein [Pusillimonas sp.]
MIASKQDIIEIIKTANVAPDTSALRSDIALQDQGIDSLGVFSIMLLIEEKYGIKVEDADIDQLTTIESIITYLDKKVG